MPYKGVGNGTQVLEEQHVFVTTKPSSQPTFR